MWAEHALAVDAQRRTVATLGRRWGMSRGEVLAEPAALVERVLIVAEEEDGAPSGGSLGEQLQDALDVPGELL